MLLIERFAPVEIAQPGIVQSAFLMHANHNKESSFRTYIEVFQHKYQQSYTLHLLQHRSSLAQQPILP